MAKPQKNNHEEDALEIIGGLIMTNKAESEDDLWGWRFAMFQEIGGPDLMRALSTRFQLLQQARDVIRKASKCLASSEASDDNKKSIRTLIETSAHWAMMGINYTTWFEEAVNLLNTMNVTYTIEEVSESPAHKIDMELA